MSEAAAVPPVPDDVADVVPQRFRRAVGRFATGVCVVSTRHEGVDHAMTANAFTSVSLEPPMVLVCVAQRARFHEAILAATGWAVSILDVAGRPAADWLATPGRPLQGQLASVPFRRGPHTGAALVEAASAWVECRTHAVHEAGDHSIVVGRVLGVDLADVAGAPLLYHRAGYRRLASPERA